MFKRLLKSFLEIVVALVVLIEIIGVTCINHFMFVPQVIRHRYTEKSEGYVNLGDKNNVIAAVVLGPKNCRKAILRCHGNGENMYQSIEVLKTLTKRGFFVSDRYMIACVDYPGYGLSSGKPTEEGCYRNVHRLYDWLVEEQGINPQDIIVDGFSIGSGPAVELASTKPVGGLILEAPFLSAPRVVTRVRVLPIDPFPNAERVLWGIKCPMLIFHGTDDRVVPYWHGKELHRLSQERNYGWNKDEGGYRWYRNFVSVEGADHAEIAPVLGIDKYLGLVTEFAETICGRKGKVPVKDDISAEVESFNVDLKRLWAWRNVCNPLLAGLLFGGLVFGAMIYIGWRQRRRAQERHREECRKIAEQLEGKRLESKPAEPEKIDKPIHLDDKTMPLDLKKLVKTGAPYDKGGMG